MGWVSLEVYFMIARHTTHSVFLGDRHGLVCFRTVRFEGMNCDLLTAKKGRDFRVHGLGMNVTLSLVARGRLDRCLGGGDGIHHIIQQHNFARYRHY